MGADVRRRLAVAAAGLLLTACSPASAPQAAGTDAATAAASPSETAGASPSPAPERTEPTEAATERRQARGGDGAAAEPRLDEVAVALEPVARLDAPTAMTVAPDGKTLWVSERGGRVRALSGGEVADEPVLDISDRTTTDGERGLLGLAVSPDGDELYVSYTNREGDSRLDAYTVDGARVDPGSRRELLAVDQPYSNHNGGDIAIGPDGMLYLGLGDGGSAGDPQGNGQDRSTLLGSLLRIDPRPGGGDPYSIPDGNPFVGAGDARPEIWAYGLRNPWRFSFDRETGDLWISDVGQSALEEINFAPAGEGAGANYGWNLREGTQAYNGGERPDGNVDPIAQYSHDDGCSITGGFVYRGQALPALRGAYVYTDLCAGDLRALVQRGGEVTQTAGLGVEVAQPVSFGQGPDGELYVLSLSGDVLRLVSAG